MLRFAKRETHIYFANLQSFGVSVGQSERWKESSLDMKQIVQELKSYKLGQRLLIPSA